MFRFLDFFAGLTVLAIVILYAPLIAIGIFFVASGVYVAFTFIPANFWTGCLFMALLVYLIWLSNLLQKRGKSK